MEVKLDLVKELSLVKSIGSNYLILPGDLSEDSWLDIGKTLNNISTAHQWWVGDWLNYGYDRYEHGQYEKALELFPQYEKETLRRHKQVAKLIKSGIRIPDLSFNHHQLVAPYSEEEQKKLLKEAKDNKWTVRDFQRYIRRYKASKEKKREQDFPSGKFRIIYADPPWEYGNEQPSYQTEQADYYPLMSIEEISQFKIQQNGDEKQIKEILMENAVLFIWVTSPILEESFKVIQEWGFKYKSSFIWDKISHNMGHYNSVRHELLLICTKGSCTPDIQKLFDSVQSIKRTKHSEKPEEFRKIIDTIYPYGRRIELFSRKDEVKGWELYGNEKKS